MPVDTTANSLPDSNQKTISLTQDDIVSAFENRNFELLYQPQMSINNEGKVIGAEAFVQLNHPVHQQVKAGEIIPLIIEMGLMKELTIYVATQIAQDLKVWQTQGNDLRVSMNIQLEMLDDPTVVNEMVEILTQAEVPLNLVTLEISQAGQNEVSDSTREIMTSLRMKGFRIALDDFGASPGIEEQLADLPIDEIKINRHILTNLQDTDTAERTVKRALHISASLGLQVIAVGVESELHLNWLNRMGCENAQGYFFGHPVTAENFRQQILENTQFFTIDSVPERLKLLIIEDDGQQQALLKDTLQELFEISVASSIAEAQASFETIKPQLLLIDVNLPDGSGIDLCRELNQGQYQDTFSALFISGDDTMQNRLKAYEAGGTDFICKPFILPELIAKLGRLAIHQSKRSQLSSNAEQFQSVALQSMQEAAHYGGIIQFFKALLTCRDEQSIANELFTFLENKGLVGSIQFAYAGSFSTFDQRHSTPSPIEMNIFELLRSKGRLFDFGKRTIVNDRHVSFLIKNMPADQEEHGRIRDYTAIMIEGIEARYRDILRQRLIQSVFSQLKTLAQEMSQAMKEGSFKQTETLDFFSMELKMSFHALDLTMNQEEHISTIVDKMLKAKEETELSTSDVDQKINAILEEVSTSLEDLERQAETSQTEAPANEVELF